MRKVKAEKNLETELSEIVAADADSGRLERTTEGSVVAEWIEPTMMVAYVNIEHQRLQLAVVEAAKAWYDNGHHSLDTQLLESIEALLQFEAEQKNGNT